MISDDGLFYDSPFIHRCDRAFYSAAHSMETKEKFLLSVFLFSILDVYDGRG